MPHRTSDTYAPVYLGIEAGATHTVVAVACPEAPSDKTGLRVELGPANLRLMTDAELMRRFYEAARRVPKPDAMAIGMAGARTEKDRQRIRAAAARVWPGIPCFATNDLETALMAAEISASATPRNTRARSGAPLSPNQKRRSSRGSDKIARVLVLSGTGSCCFGRTWDGRKTAKVGGWGHLLGDKGSAYDVALRALKAIVFYWDRDQEWSELGQCLLRALLLNEPEDLLGWIQQARKDDVARLAVEVFEAWKRRDAIARDIVTAAAHGLARDALACATNLKPSGPVHFVLAGSVLLKQPRFANLVRREILQRRPEALVTPLQRSGVDGALALARRHFPPSVLQQRRGRPRPRTTAAPMSANSNDISGSVSRQSDAERMAGLSRSPTEQRNPRSLHLDRMSIRAAIDLMLGEEALIARGLRAERAAIERAIQLIVEAFRRGGRLFYVGAGTSGRLGVLDASECPPTFRTDPELVQGIMAGGQTALWSAVEGAEDDPEAGARAIVHRGVHARDVVVGIAASGRTPFVWGALNEARRRRARTVMLSFNPNLKIPPHERPSVVIAPSIGPEILTGSTRLKAGTATKLVLNMFTTIAMVRLGKVLGNLMIDVKASNVKLRDRAVRIVCELSGVTPDLAKAALIRRSWRIQEAWTDLRRRSRTD